MRTKQKLTLPIIAALLAGITYMVVAGTPAPTIEQGTAPSTTPIDPPQPLTVDAAAAIELLDQIDPTTTPPTRPYSRDDFGQRWADVDRNGCDTRNDQLARDLVDITIKPGTHNCVVLTGILHDPYTGADISFTRGQGTSELVQVDHVVPLSWAARNGAELWTAELRTQFANDPINLQATDGPTNQSKSDRGPGSWMPPNSAYACTYAIRFVQIVSNYSLTIATEDEQSLRTTLNTCRGAA